MPEKKTAADEAAEKGQPADTVEAPPEDAVEDIPLGPYTTLNTFLRNGIEVEVGKAITFAKHEVGHVRDLLEARAIHPGTGVDAREAVEAAEAEREIGRNTPPTA